MKIIITIITKNLDLNSLVSLFWTFVETRKKEPNFQEVSGLVKKNISVYLFIASRALFQHCAKNEEILNGKLHFLRSAKACRIK